MQTIIFTDGASRGNPGPGGWGAVIVRDGYVRELGGVSPDTTNNKMELTGATIALNELDKLLTQNSNSSADEDVTIYTDSSYVINGITKWIRGWKTNGWQTKTKQDVSNKELWIELDSLVQNKKISWKYVGGHVGVKGNERCDEIATSFADGKNIDLFVGDISQYSIKDISDVSSDSNLSDIKKKSSSRSSAKAYSYISAVGGEVMIHKTWAECEKRVKGVSGARFKKSLNIEEEKQIIDSFKRG